MKRILINESERQRILNMHKSAILNEQNPFADLVSSQTASIQKANIKGRFGEEIFNQVKEVADKKGLTQVNDIQNDSSFYQWSKDLGGGNKLMLFLYNPNNDNPISAGVLSYVDRDNGQAYTMASGKWGKSANLKMGIYPSEDNVYRVSTKLFTPDDLKTVIDKLTKQFQSSPKQTQQPTATQSTGVIKTLEDNKSKFPYKYYQLNKENGTLTSSGAVNLNTTTKIDSWNFKDQDVSQLVYIEKIEGNKVTLTNSAGNAVVTVAQ